MPRLLPLALGLALLAGPGSARPAPPPATPAEGPGASVDLPWTDVAITAAAGAGWIGLHLAGPSMVEPRCPCAPDEVNPFDRIAIEPRLSFGEPLADGLLAVGVGAALAAVTLDGPVRQRIDDGLIVLQSAAVAGLLGAGFKAAVGRPYPYMYGPAPYPGQNSDGINYAAFPSGHTAVPMAAAVSAGYIFARRNPTSGWRWVVYTVGPALALAAGAAQIGAANHFPSDVIGGAALGVGVGLLDPWLHDIASGW